MKNLAIVAGLALGASLLFKNKSFGTFNQAGFGGFDNPTNKRKALSDYAASFDDPPAGMSTMIPVGGIYLDLLKFRRAIPGLSQNEVNTLYALISKNASENQYAEGNQLIQRINSMP